jgi:adenine deaminase
MFVLVGKRKAVIEQAFFCAVIERYGDDRVKIKSGFCDGFRVHSTAAADAWGKKQTAQRASCENA